MNSNLAENIAVYRQKIGWSQEDLAEKLDVSRQSISKWENGMAEPCIDKLLILSRLFSVTIDELVSRSHPSEHDIPQDSVSDSFRLYHICGFNVSALLDDLLLESDDEGILYDDFSGIPFYESVYNNGTKPTPGDISLKLLLYSISDDFKRLPPQWIYIVTKKTPAEMHAFCLWLQKNASSLNLAAVYMVYEQNTNYDYRSIRIDVDNNDFTTNEEWNFIKKKLTEQQYSGPFPPPALYKALKDKGLEEHIPYWFMTGNL